MLVSGNHFPPVPVLENAVRSDIFHAATLLLSVNASFYDRVARIEDREKAEHQEEKEWQGQVEARLGPLDRQATLGLSLDVARGVQRTVLAVFSLLLPTGLPL
jgi:hypothetical protein